MATDVHFLIGDCLRYADSGDETLPFCHELADLTAERCYSPSTWTVPSHASLYTTENPVDHGVTRFGDSLKPKHAQLPKEASSSGFTTALFSENPSFGPARGFDSGIDYCDSDIDLKVFSSNFSPTMVSESISIDSVPKITNGVLRSSAPFKNLVNLIYGTRKIFKDTNPHNYPHTGTRVQRFLEEFLVENHETSPILTFTNLLDPHNPHHSPPPDRVKDAFGITVTRAETEALAAVKSKDVLFTDKEPPQEVATQFSTWEEVYNRQHEIYRAQIRETDFIIEDLFESCNRVLDDSIVIITGDHGHLFYEDELVGHHSWLHPKLIHVPLFISFPSDWDKSPITLKDPISLVDIARAVQKTINADIDSTDGFVSELCLQDDVIVVSDGPSWDVDSLFDEYPASEVDKVAAKRVGKVFKNSMIVYERQWRSESIMRKEYSITSEDRDLQNIEEVDEVPDSNLERWIRAEKNVGESHTVSKRLKDLGYVE